MPSALLSNKYDDQQAINRNIEELFSKNPHAVILFRALRGAISSQASIAGAYDYTAVAVKALRQAYLSLAPVFGKLSPVERKAFEAELLSDARQTVPIACRSVVQPINLLNEFASEAEALIATAGRQEKKESGDTGKAIKAIETLRVQAISAIEHRKHDILLKTLKSILAEVSAVAPKGTAWEKGCEDAILTIYNASRAAEDMELHRVKIENHGKVLV